MIASRTKMMDKGGRDHVGDRQGCRIFLIGLHLTKSGCPEQVFFYLLKKLIIRRFPYIYQYRFVFCTFYGTFWIEDNFGWQALFLAANSGW